MADEKDEGVELKRYSYATAVDTEGVCVCVYTFKSACVMYVHTHKCRWGDGH